MLTLLDYLVQSMMVKSYSHTSQCFEKYQESIHSLIYLVFIEHLHNKVLNRKGGCDDELKRPKCVVFMPTKESHVLKA